MGSADRVGEVSMGSAGPSGALPLGSAGPSGALPLGSADRVGEVSMGFVGRVEQVFREGFYVLGGSESLFAVLGPRCWPGPLHLIVEELAQLPSRHDRVSVSQDRLRTGRWTVRLDQCTLWAPGLPEHLDANPRAWQGLAVCPAPELAAVWEAVTGDLRRGDLSAVARRLQGRGTGLTPSGDDVLAGILVVCATDPNCRPALARLVRGARTTRLSRSFLRWAAAGHSIEPAHTLLDAAASGDRTGMRRAAASLAAVGATSGRALASGIALAALELPHRLARPPSRPTAA